MFTATRGRRKQISLLASRSSMNSIQNATAPQNHDNTSKEPLGTHFWFKDLNQVKCRTGFPAIIERSEFVISYSWTKVGLNGRFSALRLHKHDKIELTRGRTVFGAVARKPVLHFTGFFYSLTFLQKGGYSQRCPLATLKLYSFLPIRT